MALHLYHKSFEVLELIDLTPCTHVGHVQLLGRSCLDSITRRPQLAHCQSHHQHAHLITLHTGHAGGCSDW